MIQPGAQYAYLRVMDGSDRTEATLTGREREQIESFLHDNRVEVLSLLDGLTEEPLGAHEPRWASRTRPRRASC